MLHVTPFLVFSFRTLGFEDGSRVAFCIEDIWNLLLYSSRMPEGSISRILYGIKLICLAGILLLFSLIQILHLFFMGNSNFQLCQAISQEKLNRVHKDLLIITDLIMHHLNLKVWFGSNTD